VPFWLVAAFAGLRGMIEVWPAALVTGLSFAVVQLLVSNFHGPWLVDILAAACSTAALVLFLRVWRPKAALAKASGPARYSTRAQGLRPLLPWALLCAIVFLWGLPQVRGALDAVSAIKIPVPGLDGAVWRTPPVVREPHAESAVYTLNWLSATGTGILVAAILSGLLLRVRLRDMARLYGRTLAGVRNSLLTIAAMLALGFTTRYAGIDAALGLAFSRAGFFYPFFGTLLGWLGVALTGSDTASNVLFGGLQTASAGQLGLSANLMAAANSSGGVMGKMIDAQSIVVASTATRWFGHEDSILRFVFLHSLGLAALVGLLVMLQAHVPPFTAMIVP
jgi:lactate permease